MGDEVLKKPVRKPLIQEVNTSVVAEASYKQKPNPPEIPKVMGDEVLKKPVERKPLIQEVNKPNPSEIPKVMGFVGVIITGDTKSTENVIFSGAKQKVIEVVANSNMPQQRKDEVVSAIKLTNNFEELGAVNKKYEKEFRQYNIWDQINKIYQDELQKYQEQQKKSQPKGGGPHKVQQEEITRRKKAQILAEHVGSAEEKGRQEAEKSLDNKSVPKTKPPEIPEQRKEKNNVEKKTFTEGTEHG